ncbi:phage/plasmid primase, P4 family [Phenylobacterium sp.]|uniref:DNA primase family protein n=1 Tax=Phenylobacterium sp. TaxID=1871053 RepID=UPI0035B4CDE9
MSGDGGYEFAGAVSPEKLARHELNDFGNAMRLIQLVGGEIDGVGDVDVAAATLLYLREIGWIGWNGRHWDLKLGQRLAERTAHKVARGLVAQHTHLVANGASKKEVSDFIKGSGNAGRIASMLKVAESYLQVDLEDFDHDPLALTVRNGTLKFQREPGDGLKIRFSAHDPADRITRMADVDYDPKAQAPEWERSLAAWQPDIEMRGFLQRAIGYVATGYTHEQVFLILQGKGRDGKSTMVGALRELLGAYADVADVRTFLDVGQRGGADASPDLARLAGDCRLVSVAEPPRGAKLAEAMIKSFTGGAPILARRLRQDLFSFMPKPKVIMECNSRPVIKGDDDGIWRRIFIVMFEHQVAKDRVDRQLPERLRREYPGILNWIIQGLGDWLSRGLDPPERILQTLEDYRKGSSPFGEWFVDCVELDAQAKTPAADFYNSYKHWCEGQGIERPMSQTAFGNALADRQVIRAGKDSAGRVLRMGARLRKTRLDGGSGAGGQGGSDPDDNPFDPRDYGLGDGQ